MNSIPKLNYTARSSVKLLTIITKFITRMNLLFLPDDFADGFIKKYKYVTTFRIYINFATRDWGYSINILNLSKMTIDLDQTHMDGSIIKTYDGHRTRNYCSTIRFKHKLIKIYKKITSIDRITIDNDVNTYEYVYEP